jgi:NTE family protein
MIALALSGGGSRAIAFHLGCMRALYDRGVLEKVKVISSVSGGSVIAGLYAYEKKSFESFDQSVVELLHRGLQRDALRHLLSPGLLARVAATNLIARPAATISRLRHREPPFRRWASRTDALEAALKDVFGMVELGKVARAGLDVVFNACELRTGSAFRFGNKLSGGWRAGTISHNQISVAHAVTCSAAYPLLLPAIDREYSFLDGEDTQRRRVVLTDGGVYDNLGISCLEPGRDHAFSLHSYPADYIICCYAGHGQLSGAKVPFGFIGRTDASFQSVFRKVQDVGLQRLHMHKSSGTLKGFILPYLGQQDRALPIRPPDLVRRNEVFGYPTDFAAMSDENICKLSKRGEQLTRILLAHYCPEL